MRGRAEAPNRLLLQGRTVVVCRAEDEAGPMLHRLEALGAATVSVPLHRLADPADGGAALTAAVAELASYRWLAVTSANSVRAIEPHLAGPVPDSTSVAAVGPATAAALADIGIRVDLVPAKATAQDLAAAFPAADPGHRVLAPLNAAAAATLTDGLEAKGYSVDRVDAYRMVRTEPSGDVAADVARADAVLFTAPSQVEAFVDRFGLETAPPVVACIGPSTANAATERGLNPIDPPTDHNIASLIDALIATGFGAERLASSSAGPNSRPVTEQRDQAPESHGGFDAERLASSSATSLPTEAVIERIPETEPSPEQPPSTKGNP